MNHGSAATVITLLLAGGVILFPVGYGGQDEPVAVELRIDESPIDRETVPGLHSYASMLRLIQPAVVSVYSERMIEHESFGELPNLPRFFEDAPSRVQSGVGSGVIVSPLGYILTNNHVIEGAERIVVQLPTNGEIEAEIIGRDPATDIAVLRIQASPSLPSAVLADSDQVQVGDVVFALGNALGIGHAVTSGIISARGRTSIGILGEEGYEDFLQTDASMNVGNSGGPLVDSLGRVIGINTAIASPGGGNVGVGFAIPINMARDVMESLIETGEVRRGYLGLTLQDPERSFVQEYGAPDRGNETDGQGVRVVTVVEESPAARAGLVEGDLLVSLNGKPVDSASGLRLKVSRLAPGTEVALGVIRAGERLEFPVVLGQLGDVELEPEPEVPGGGVELLPGLMVTPLTPELREQLDLADDVAGLFVTEVAGGSLHSDVFPPGSVILQINRQPVNDVETAREAIKEGRNLFLVLFEGAFHYLMVEVEER